MLETEVECRNPKGYRLKEQGCKIRPGSPLQVQCKRPALRPNCDNRKTFKGHSVMFTHPAVGMREETRKVSSARSSAQFCVWDVKQFPMKWSLLGASV